jgi:hypothetical protein
VIRTQRQAQQVRNDQADKPDGAADRDRRSRRHGCRNEQDFFRFLDIHTQLHGRLFPR